MLGAVAGDIIGSMFEFHPVQNKTFELFSQESSFTDDTVLTVAIASALMTDGDYLSAVVDWAKRYPHAGYGARFLLWLHADDHRPYGSFGNGSAMRVSPIGFAFDTVNEVLAEATRSAAITHDHPEGIKGAQATALAILLARTTHDKETVRREISARFGYDLSRPLDFIRPGYSFDETCQSSVPEAITAFLESIDYEDAVRNAVSLGGDADTLACIAGGIAEAFYGPIPQAIRAQVLSRLEPDLRDVTIAFERLSRNSFGLVSSDSSARADG